MAFFFGKHLKTLTCACVHALHSEIIKNIFFMCDVPTCKIKYKSKAANFSVFIDAKSIFFIRSLNVKCVGTPNRHDTGSYKDQNIKTI